MLELSSGLMHNNVDTIEWLLAHKHLCDPVVSYLWSVQKCSVDPVVSCSRMLTWFSGFMWSSSFTLTNFDTAQWFQAYRCWHDSMLSSDQVVSCWCSPSFHAHKCCYDPVVSCLHMLMWSSEYTLTNFLTIRWCYAHKRMWSSGFMLTGFVKPPQAAISRLAAVSYIYIKLHENPPNSCWDEVSDQPSDQRHHSVVDQGDLNSLCGSLHHTPYCTTYIHSRGADHPACKSTCATHFCLILIKTHLREYKCEPIIQQAGESVTPPPTVLPAAVSLPHRHFKR